MTAQAPEPISTVDQQSTPAQPAQPSRHAPEIARGRAADLSREPLGLELVELELTLDAFEAERNGFAETVRAAAKAMKGELLFDLPASGLAEGCQKIAAVRLPSAAGRSLCFVLLSEDGSSITVRAPDPKLEGLARFAEAFVDLLQRFPEPVAARPGPVTSDGQPAPGLPEV